MEARSLILTPWYLPHKVVCWQDAVTMLYLEKVDVVVSYAEEIRSPSVTMQAPAVVRIRRPLKPRKRGVRFSRTNVLTRDRYTCQYCGSCFAERDLTFDHVLPRSRGGRTEWENIVAACRSCNGKKAARTPDEAGMFPLNRPVKPAKLPGVDGLPQVRNAPVEWEPFLAAVGL